MKNICVLRAFEDLLKAFEKLAGPVVFWLPVAQMHDRQWPTEEKAYGEHDASIKEAEPRDSSEVPRGRLKPQRQSGSAGKGHREEGGEDDPRGAAG